MYLSLTKTKFQKRGGWDMKKSWLSGVLMLLAVLPAAAQQVMYSNLKELVENRGDTVTTLKIEKRTKNQIYLMGGADYRITVDDNPGLCRYLKSRCYAVRVDTLLYVNCRKCAISVIASGSGMHLPCGSAARFTSVHSPWDKQPPVP